MKEDRIKDQSIESGELTGFLDEGTDFSGDMKFSGTMRIDGKYEGKIKSDSTLIIGESADIKVDTIEIGSISINGRIEGNIVAKEKVEIHSRGRVYGSIKTPSLIIDDGAILQGQCDMDQKVAKEKPAEEVKKK